MKSFRTLGLEPSMTVAPYPLALLIIIFAKGIKLLGFKDRKELSFEDNIKHSFFIYPDEHASQPTYFPLQFV